MVQKTRSGYIDVFRFVMSLLVLEFHLNSGMFPGGRIAVEGFFIISAYLMMAYIDRNEYPDDSIGISTIRFIVRKYMGLIPYLLPSVCLSYAVYVVKNQLTFLETLTQIPLLIFELIPLREAGFRGIYVIGISWYLSTMFLSLVILYPLIRKSRTGITLIVCPVFALLAYGFLSHNYGHLAIASMFIEGIPISAGLIRGMAGCALGCFMYEISMKIQCYTPTVMARFFFTAFEIVLTVYFFYVMHTYPKSRYDYTLIFVIFALLLIGVSNLSVTGKLFNPKYTKILGTWSTLIVLNHCCWRDYLPKILGEGYQNTSAAWYYYIAVTLSCVVVYLASKAIRFVMKKMQQKE